MNAALDKHNFRAYLEDFPTQVREASRLGQQVRAPDPVNKVIIAGVGTGAVTGELIATLFRYQSLPIITISEHALPHWVNETTLVFILSHSGEESVPLSCYAEAVRKKAQIIVITSGGKLRFVTRDHNAKVITIPRGMPERIALAYMLFPIGHVLEASGLAKSLAHEIQQVNKTLENTDYRPKAEQLATKLKNHVPVIITGPKLYPAALRWKQMCNTTAKTQAITACLPRAMHEELLGFEHLTGNYHVVLLRDEREHREVQKQFDFLKRHLKQQGVQSTEIALKGQSSLNKLVSAIHLGDWTAYFLALLHEVDPSPLRSLEEWKSS